jgi:hypothetical protein
MIDSVLNVSESSEGGGGRNCLSEMEGEWAVRRTEGMSNHLCTH